MVHFYKEMQETAKAFPSKEEFCKPEWNCEDFKWDKTGVKIVKLSSKGDRGVYAYSLHDTSNVDNIVKEFLDRIGLQPVPRQYDRDCIVELGNIKIVEDRDVFTIEITPKDSWNLKGNYWLADPYKGLLLVHILPN